MPYPAAARKADGPVSIGRAEIDSGGRLARLAALDSQRLPSGPWLVAELDGAVVAALSLADGSFVADPFSRTVELRALLELRAQQLRAAERAPSRGLRQPRRPRWLSAARAAPS